ncbi:hypothetical protein [Brevibacillus laterosporus]|uniref:hypothetical protein n=1 Tax=Brevibacillus laterosporus TaxID=1465 RepID=UPI0003FDD004|nr:hypothetical protein [Brevibacillus laterosporus]
MNLKLKKGILSLLSVTCLSLTFTSVVTASSDNTNVVKDTKYFDPSQYNMHFDHETGWYVDVSGKTVYDPVNFRLVLIEANVYLDLKNKKIIPMGTPKGIVKEQKVVSATLKAIKGFGKIVRAGGWVLEKTIGLWSKSKADLIRKYSREIADACEMLETGTKKALIKALKRFNVPEDVAKDITDIIFWFI